MLSAIIYTENARGFYGAPLEYFGVSKSLLPANISAEWEILIPGADVNNSTDNIRLAAKLISEIVERLDDPSIENVYSLYNSGLSHDSTYTNRETKSTPYFAKKVMEERAWEEEGWKLKGPTSAHCFTSGTLIRMADGSEKPIEAIVSGDQVLAFDASAHNGQSKLIPARVVQTFIKHDQKVIDFHGVKVTPGHVFLNGEGKFQKLEDILAEDGTVVLEDGTIINVRTGRPVNANDERPLSAVGAAVSESRVLPMEGLHTVYNFEVEGLHTYVAAGYRVHNDSQWVIDTAGSIGQTFGTMLAQKELYATVDKCKNTTCTLDAMHATMH